MAGGTGFVQEWRLSDQFAPDDCLALRIKDAEGSESPYDDPYWRNHINAGAARFDNIGELEMHNDAPSVTHTLRAMVNQDGFLTPDGDLSGSLPV